ncbi:MAG: tetratricopeptide repeat protein [Desulfovibrionaceae bacterium]|nr:tetratricopeptide repeat protein [Desulfovibrionaceae bacterium]
MAKLFDLVENVLPKNLDLAREGPGIAAWVNWTGELNLSVEQAFQDYGGRLVIKNENSGLWFFFSSEVFLAIARGQLWAKMHKFNISIVLMPAKIYISEGSRRSISLDEKFLDQTTPPLDGLTVWVHPDIAPLGQGIPGLIFEPLEAAPGMVPLNWFSMFADSRLVYRTNLGWYCILKPLGNPLEKSFQVGWRDFFSELENILHRQKFKYTISNNFLMFPIETLSKFNSWMREQFALVKSLKKDTAEHYWPFVHVIIDKKGQVFSADLPNKVGLDWEQLMPDFPHMTFRNAYLLGDDFTMHDVRFETSTQNIDDWCNVSLISEDSNSDGFLPAIIPVSLVSGKNQPCFYCGMRNHTAAECPSVQIKNWSPSLWNPVGMMSFDSINAGLRKIDSILGEQGLAGMHSLLEDRPEPENHLLRAIFDINTSFQIHNLPRVWLSRSKDWPGDPSKGMGQKESHPIWAFMEKIPEGDPIPLEKELQGIIQHYPRDWRLVALNGFFAVERDDLIRASQLWKEAELMTSAKIHIAFIKYLQARIMEIQGKYEHAGSTYREVSGICPNWLEPKYRQIVCRVKMGFAEQAIPALMQIIDVDPNFFNRALIDPEMERGHIQMQSSLYTPWILAEDKIPGELAELEMMKRDLTVWFSDENDFLEKITKKIDAVLALGGVANYVPYQKIIRQKSILLTEKQDQITVETRNLRNRLKIYKNRLIKVQEEAAWFPFPRLINQFTRVFNSVASSTAWALKANLYNSDNFQKATRIADREEERVKKLESQIRFLRIVRDSTLFALIMGKLLIWMELFVLILVFAGVPLGVYYADKASIKLAAGLPFSEQWQVQKILVVTLSICALLIAAFRTASVFEKRRNKLLQKGRERMMKAKK